MTLSDRVLVMNRGRIAQAGTPREIYEYPGSQFVMDFLGQVDHLGARVVRAADGTFVARPDGVDGAVIPLGRDRDWRDGEQAVLAFRPADIVVCPGAADGCWPGIVQSSVYLGERVQYVIKVGAAVVRASGPAAESLGKGALVQLHVPASAIRAWPVHR
jgi:ABC-type Fe3+/spermidine/putrescine transport system ATPase subunit